MKTKKMPQKAKAVSRRTFNKTLGATALTLTLFGGATAYRFFYQNEPPYTEEYHVPAQPEVNNSKPGSPLYVSAKSDPIQQEKWVKDLLVRNSIDDLFEEVIIVTPQNAYKYENEFNRQQRVGSSGAEVATYYQVEAKDIGTNKTPLPKLFVPMEVFRVSEGDLTSIIAFHEANHAWIARNGFGFISMNYFRHKNNPQLFDLSMFKAVYELEAHKEQLEKGKDIMSSTQAIGTKRDYMGYYIQLWRYGLNLREDITETLKVRYFQPWMKEMDSLGVYEEGNAIVYDGPRPFRFFILDKNGQGKIQFEFKGKTTGGVIDVALPHDALRK